MAVHRIASAARFVRTALTAGSLTAILGLGAIGVISTPHQQPEELGLSARPLSPMMTHNRCSYTGFDSDVIPSKAIVRDTAGHVRLVSFQHGWDVFTGKRDGQLVAVCLGPKPAR